MEDYTKEQLRKLLDLLNEVNMGEAADFLPSIDEMVDEVNNVLEGVWDGEGE